MPFEISIFKEGGYIRIRHYGEISVAEIGDARNAAIKKVLRHFIFKILVDVCEVTNKLSTLDAFSATSDHSKIKRPGLRGAIVAREDQMEDARFMENVAVNRGMNIRAFHDMERALSWLLK